MMSMKHVIWSKLIDIVYSATKKTLYIEHHEWFHVLLCLQNKYMKSSWTERDIEEMCQLIVEVYACARTEVIVSAVATMSASPALTICSSRSFSMGSIPLGTLSISENIRCSSAPGRRRKRRKSCCTLDKNHTGWIQNFCTCRVYRCVTEGQGGRGLSTSTIHQDHIGTGPDFL